MLGLNNSIIYIVFLLYLLFQTIYYNLLLFIGLNNCIMKQNIRVYFLIFYLMSNSITQY
jgi:hypothetical protein